MHSTLINFISVLAFTLAHLPFHSLIMLVVTFVMGISYLKNYLKYQNIYTVMLAHAFTGALLILIRNFYLPYS
jgi:membrane protease YdiL (CAAX protease family)